MKVAFVLGTSTGGTGRHVRMLAAGCAARAVAVEVFGPAQTDRDFGFSAIEPADGRDGFSAVERPDGRVGFTAVERPDGRVGFTAVEIADRPRVVRDLRAIRRLRRLLRAWRPDVLHAHGLRAGALTAVAAALVRPTVYAPRPALIVTVHNAPLAGGVTGAIYRVLELIVARSADSVLCVSPDLEERMRAAGARRVGHAQVPAFAAPALAVPPLDTSAAAGGPVTPSEDVSAETRLTLSLAGDGDVSVETRAALSLPGDQDPSRPVVLAVGRLAPQKGFGTLLEAAALWRDIQPQPLLVIVGEGPLEAGLKAQAVSLRLDARFTGQRDDVPALLAAAAVFVLPSVWEGQPLILQEALAAGVPVVATRVGGTPALTGEDAALLVPPGAAAPLAGAVRAVLADPGLAARLRKAAADRAHALPTPDDAVAAALAEYDHVTRLRRAP